MVAEHEFYDDAGDEEIRADIENTRAAIARTRADIEQTRAELTETVRVLSAEFEPKTPARRRAQESGRASAGVAGEAAGSARWAAPHVVRSTLSSVRQVAKPAMARTGADARRAALIAVGVGVVLIVLWRARRR